MILVDTSIWIAVLRREFPVDPDDYEDFYTCGPVMQEVLQGFNDSHLTGKYARFFMDIPRLSDPLQHELFVNAADIYRQGRRRGLTIRSPADCLIAAIALENDATIWHRDRDFDNIAQFTNLKVRRSAWES
jgi:predicted nucleic acid-binding protein